MTLGRELGLEDGFDAQARNLTLVPITIFGPRLSMSVGFYLLGQLKTHQLEPDAFLKDIEHWIVANTAELEPTTRRGFIDEKPSLFALLHPAAEEIEICLMDPNHLTVSANTSTVGPGYHIYLSDLLHRWTKEFSVKWETFGPDDDTIFGDETDYFFTGDKSMVYGHMGSWLKTLTGSFFDGTLDSDAKSVALCMPMNTQFEADFLAVTQLGPRDKAWLRQMSEGLLHQSEFFSWFDVGLTAEYYRGRALVQMWSNIRWRKPVNNYEKQTISSTLGALETAYRKNPNLQMPWNEWHELSRLTGTSVPFVRDRVTGPGQIGYRRGRARVSLPGHWSIESEGSFSEFESHEDGSLSSFDPPREIWFTAYSFSADDPTAAFRNMRQDVLNQNRELVHETEEYISAASISQKSEGYYMLQSTNVGILCRSICTLIFESPQDREWAIRVWKSIKAPARNKGDKD
jgi:hypothetical protein